MKYLKYLLLLFIIFITPNVFAQSINADSYSQKDSFNNARRYDYSLNNYLGDDTNFDIGSIGTRYNGRSYYFQFNFHHSITANKIYELKVSSTSSDFTSDINLERITPLCYTSFAYNFNTKTCPDISIISVIRNASGNNQSSNFTIRFSPLNNYTYWGFKFAGGFYNLTGVNNFLVNDFDLTEVGEEDNSEEIINNATQNTQDIINNANNNTNIIINNLNELMNTCKVNLINPNSPINFRDVSFSNNGSQITVNYTQAWGIVGWYYELEPNKTYTFSYRQRPNTGIYATLLTYDSSNNPTTIINDFTGTSYTFTTGSNVVRGRLTFFSNIQQSNVVFNDVQVVNTSYSTSYIPYDRPQCTSKLDDVNTGINNVNDSINNPSIDNGVGSDFFNNFSSQDFGLSTIITLPLTTIQSLANTSCVSLNIPIPFTNSTIPLPCMTQVYQTYIPSIFSIWQVVSFGIIAYFICIDIVHLVKGFKDPDSDKVEVLDL